MLHSNELMNINKEQHFNMETNIIDNVLLTLMKSLGYVQDGHRTPTTKECEHFIASIDKDFILNYEYIDDINAWHFIVRNMRTGYYYRQPPYPEMTLETAQIWGLEHVLRRL